MINTVSKIIFSKNRVGRRGVNINLDNVFKYTGFFLTLALNIVEILHYSLRGIPQNLQQSAKVFPRAGLGRSSNIPSLLSMLSNIHPNLYNTH